MLKKTTLLLLLLLVTLSGHSQSVRIGIVDDYFTHNPLEKGYQDYFSFITAHPESEALDLDFTRYCVEFSYLGPRSIHELQLKGRPDYVLIILGTSSTLIDHVAGMPKISTSDFERPYLKTISKIRAIGAYPVVVIPPAYPFPRGGNRAELEPYIDVLVDIAKRKSLGIIDLYHPHVNAMDRDFKPLEAKDIADELMQKLMRQLKADGFYGDAYSRF